MKRSDVASHVAPWFPLMLALGAILVFALPSFTYPFGRDQAMFAYIGDRWLHGALPYRDAWDIKPPGVFAAYAAAQLLFGHSMAACRFADLIAAFSTAVVLFALARRYVPASGAALTAALFGIAYYGEFDFWNTAQAESFAAPVTALYVLLLLKASEGTSSGEAGSRSPTLFAIAGVCLGALAVIKTTFALYLLIAVPAVLALPEPEKERRQRAAAVVALLAGAAMPVILVIVYYAARNGLRYLPELLIAQKEYANHQLDNLAYRALPAIRDFLSRHSVAALLTAVLGIGGVLRMPRSLPGRSVLFAWLALAVLLLLVQGRLYEYHYLPIIPPLALIGGCFLSRLLGSFVEADQTWGEDDRGAPVQRFARRPVRVAVAGLTMLFFVYPSTGQLRQMVALWTGSLPRSTYEASFVGPWAFSAVENRAVADYIAARTEPGDPILVYAFEPSIYYLSGRSSPTRHLSMAPITGEVQISPRLRGRWSAEQAIDCDRCPPRYIVLIALPSREIERQWEEHRTVVITAGRLRYTPVKGIGQFRILRLLDGEYNGRAVGGAAQ